MPDVGNREAVIINLYQRCQEFKALPFSGGVLDQPAWLMDCFSVIEREKSLYEQKKNRDFEREEIRAKQKQELYV